MDTNTIIRKQQELIDALMGRDMDTPEPAPVDTPEPAPAPAPAFVFDTDTDVTPDVTAGPRFTIVTPEQTSVTLTAPEPVDTPEPAPAPEPAPEQAQDERFRAAQAQSIDEARVERAITVVTAGSRRKPLTPAETEACIAAWAKTRGTTFSKAQAVRECVGLNRVAVMNAIDALEAAGTLTSHVRPGGKRKRYQWA